MIWPFTLWNKQEPFKLPELKEIKIGGLLYAPQPDITTNELALLLPFFGTLHYYIGRERYLIDNNLMRHFKRDLN